VLSRLPIRFVFLLSLQSCIAEVVGSTPTQSLSFILVKYGIISSSILTIVGQNPTAVQMDHTAPILWIDSKATKTPKLSLKGEIEVRKLKVDRT
jgi:hypothetical protein